MKCDLRQVGIVDEMSKMVSEHQHTVVGNKKTRRVNRISLSLTVILGQILIDSDRLAAADLEYGEYLAGDCLSCHSLTQTRDRIVALGGLPEAYIITILSEFRAGKRDNQAMTTVSRSLTDDDIEAVAAYLSSLTSKDND